MQPASITYADYIKLDVKERQPYIDRIKQEAKMHPSAK
jgi:hypothetical protein